MNLYDMDDPYDDAIWNEAMDAFEEAQCGAGFKFDLIPHTDKRARKLESSTCLHNSSQCYQRFGFDSVSQSPTSHRLQRAISDQVLNGHEKDNDILMNNMASNRLLHSYQSHRMQVREWVNSEEPSRCLLDMMSKILNSNEQFQVNDSFHIEVTHVSDWPGIGQKRHQLGTCFIKQIKKIKRIIR